MKQIQKSKKKIKIELELKKYNMENQMKIINKFNKGKN